MGRSRWWAALAAAGLLLTACADRPAPPDVGVTALGRQPNIVVVLTDDLSTNLLPYMPHVLALQRAGMTFSDYTVSDSFCCPSRASILTGEFPHNTGVFTNDGPDGGFALFHRRHEEEQTFATTLQSVGYLTAFMGKYLNGYKPGAQYAEDGQREPGDDNWVPPGWSDWAVAGNGYYEYDYSLNENHHLQHYGHDPDDDYLTDVLSERGSRFVTESAFAHKPFLLELATFAPHLPAIPAKRDHERFLHLPAPRNPAWNTVPTDAPPWLADAHLTKADLPVMDRVFRKRVRSVQAVDRMVGSIEQTLQATGQAGHTIFVFTSDNGFHIGEHGLYPGKLTAFDTDVQVPLIVAGPHIPAGTSNPAVVQNVDLAPTFDQIGGAEVPGDVDGRSIVPLLLGRTVPWRDAALIEHHGGDFAGDDPDQQDARAGNPPTYEAIRTPEFTYVSYADGQREYYDHRSDPWQLHNVYDTLPASRVASLDARIRALADCSGGHECWAAAQPGSSE